MYVTFHIYDIHKNMKPMCTKYSVLYIYAMETLRAKQKMLGGFMAQRLDKDV